MHGVGYKCAKDNFTALRLLFMVLWVLMIDRRVSQRGGTHCVKQTQDETGGGFRQTHDNQTSKTLLENEGISLYITIKCAMCFSNSARGVGL